jgi:hypothetical protein
MNFAGPCLHEFLLRLCKPLALALHFEQDRAPAKAYDEIDGFLDVVAACADLFQGFYEFVLIVIGPGSAAHFVLSYILVESVVC